MFFRSSKNSTIRFGSSICYSMTTILRLFTRSLPSEEPLISSAFNIKADYNTIISFSKNSNGSFYTGTGSLILHENSIVIKRTTQQISYLLRRRKKCKESFLDHLHYEEVTSLMDWSWGDLNLCQIVILITCPHSVNFLSTSLSLRHNFLHGQAYSWNNQFDISPSWLSS